MTVGNEIVKNERTFNERERPNSFDYEETQQEDKYTEIKSSITSAGFTYTEIVPYNANPNPHEASFPMTISERYGGIEPVPIEVKADAKSVRVKTTSYILKRLVNMSPSIEVDTSLSRLLVCVNTGEDYNDKVKEKVEAAVAKWVNMTQEVAKAQL